MQRVLDFLMSFLILFIELSALFILISFLVSWLQQKVPEERITRILHRPNKWLGYLYGTGLGALTPFCSCSTIPILAGLLSSNAPFGPSMSFLIASPLMNPVVVALLGSLLGWKLTLMYVLMITFFSILVGVVWDRLGFRHAVKSVRVRRSVHSEEGASLSGWRRALQDAWAFFYPLLPFLLVGVVIGALIHNFIPADFVMTYAGSDKLWTIPIASIIGIPMYIRAEAILPIGDALVGKGMGVGAVMALLIGGAGASIPEVVLLSKLFHKKLVIAFVVSILFVATSTGLIMQMIL
ncbi:permease [Marinicrinis sediminis]|uniref:Permease n=1 Tax=Marinicrinis sediminis TaxID=1652465 RepID=A0ABW5RAQ1_9BACL